MRFQFFIGSAIIVAILIAFHFILPPIYHPIHYTISAIIGVVIIIGMRDALQKRQTIKRNFPVIGHFRYMLESIRPEIQQYFIERNTDGMPFSREDRSIVYQRAKGDLDSLPFGTQQDVYATGYEWLKHSIRAKHVDPSSLRVTIGGPDCKKPYDSSIMNISAMSFGSLSKNAVLALNGGAKLGFFAHNTGEGSISPYHLEEGGDLIWQIGTGYFGCRNDDGTFNEKLYEERSTLENVKMIELKISQGAKPGHGGILPAQKITPEIAKIRNVPLGKDVISPPSHSAFDTPIEMLQFIKKLRDLSGGKPVGFKICIGKKREFISICKAMIETGIKPDFITVDGGEGGTGAAPLEFSNHIGTPGIDSLVFVHNCLLGMNLRDDIKLINSGKVTTGFSIIKRIALGADLVYSARAMMLALGCIQALRCNSNICPAGVATQDPSLMSGLVVSDKINRVATYHRETINSTAHILGAMGLSNTKDIRPYHVVRRVNSEVARSYSDLYHFVEKGSFIKGDIPPFYAEAYRLASAETFDPLR